MAVIGIARPVELTLKLGIFLQCFISFASYERATDRKRGTSEGIVSPGKRRPT